MEKALTTICNLPPSVRVALAEATGLKLDDEQQFYIVLLNPRDEEKRRAVRADIRRIAEQSQKSIAASGMTPESSRPWRTRCLMKSATADRHDSPLRRQHLGPGRVVVSSTSKLIGIV